MLATKNMPLSPAVSSLGLGDALTNQTEAEVLERKKKLMSAATAAPPAGVAMGSQNAFSPMSLGLIASGGAQ